MKKRLAGRILLYVGGGCYALFGLLWLVMLLSTLFRGDPSIYENPAAGYGSLLMKSLVALFYLGLLPLALLATIKKDRSALRIYVMILAIASFVIGVFQMLITGTNGETSWAVLMIPLLFGIVYLAGATLYVLSFQDKEAPAKDPEKTETTTPSNPESK